MHESVETQLDLLSVCVDGFYEKYKTQEVSLAIAEDYFRRHGFVITRPLQFTLEAYGCVVRPAGIRWPHKMRRSPWIYDDARRSFRPADLG